MDILPRTVETKVAKALVTTSTTVKTTRLYVARVKQPVFYVNYGAHNIIIDIIRWLLNDRSWYNYVAMEADCDKG